MRLTKAVGTANPADMLIKNVAKLDPDKHLEFSNLLIRDGRADGSLHINAIIHGGICHSLTLLMVHRAVHEAVAKRLHSDSLRVHT